MAIPFWFFFFSLFIFLLYNTVLVLPYINMNLPRVYTCSQSWTPLPPPSPYHPSGSYQCTSPKHPVSCIRPGLVIHFICELRELVVDREALCAVICGVAKSRTQLSDWSDLIWLYMFQCHSPKSSHPLSLPLSPKDCSIHLCLFCCLAYRVIVTIF